MDVYAIGINQVYMNLDLIFKWLRIDCVLNTFHYIIFLSLNNDRTLMGYVVLLI